MHRENALDADAKAHAPHRKALARKLSAAAHHHALKRLDAFFVALAFLQAHIHANRVAGAEMPGGPCEVGTVAPYAMIGFMTIISLQTRSGGASTQRTITNYSEFRRLRRNSGCFI